MLMLRAVPSTTFIAASNEPAFRSGILIAHRAGRRGVELERQPQETVAVPPGDSVGVCLVRRHGVISFFGSNSTLANV
jgi:hypothetical protein